MSSRGNDSRSVDQQEGSGSRSGKKPSHRHTSHQIQRLEEFFKYCPHPDHSQRCQLGRELGLEPDKVKFWFQNKRTQLKTQSKRANTAALKAENESIQVEILVMRDALKNVQCDSCRGAPLGEEERQHYLRLQSLQLENALLRKEHEKLSTLVASCIGKRAVVEPWIGTTGLDFPSRSYLTMRIPILDPSSGPATANKTTLHHRIEEITSMEKAPMREIAAGAMGELVKLLQSNEPFWMKSSSSSGFVLNRDRYERVFPKNHFKTPGARVESSKDSGMVSENAIQLVEMFLNSDKWVDLFPTIITEAKTIHVVENGLMGTRTGSLQLMYQQMHSLSPLVPTREFYFLRHCVQIEIDTWVIVDISCDCFKEKDLAPSSWRFPSGCMIHQISNGCTEVTWVEHVEVDDEIQTHQLYKDLICSNVGYGAQRWIATLQRMCERLMFASKGIPLQNFQGEARKRLIEFSHNMVKNFCGILSMPGKLDVTHLSEVKNSGVQFSVRENTQQRYSDSLIISASTSLWIPLPSQNVFDFFRNNKTRAQWDVLTDGNPVLEILNVTSGTHPENCISIIQPFIPSAQTVVLQEICVDPLASMIIYAPMDVSVINIAVNHGNSWSTPILPSGLIVSGDGHQDSSTGPSDGGSLLTVFIQVLATNISPPKQLKVEAILTVNALVSSTVKKIKAALNCSKLD